MKFPLSFTLQKICMRVSYYGNRELNEEEMHVYSVTYILRGYQIHLLDHYRKQMEQALFVLAKTALWLIGCPQ